MTTLSHRCEQASADYLDGVRAGLEAAAKVAEEWFPAETAAKYPTGGVIQAIRSIDPETLA